MASLITVRLDKGSSPNLGFRLQGGKDFGTPLVVQKVNGGSPAERAGLLAGDSVIKINTTDVFNLRHKDAQDVIVRAGPSFEITVQRGGSTWKPTVTPIGSYQTAPSIQNVAPITKTSLAAAKKENIGSIGTGHNLSAKPFSPQLNGTVNGGPKLVNNQYNSPLKLYSEESIAETLSAQTEVLSTGALGVNFKKNEKNYDATNSAVYRMLQEAEKEPKTPEAVSPTTNFYATHSHAIGGRNNKALSPTPLRSSVDDRSNSRQSTGNPSDREGGVTICTDCERVIVGVFVRIKDKNLHVECFKCSTCGTSLKNVGYYNINNKLYCDVHAKLAAISNRPASNLVPVTVPPGGKVPAGTISAALASHPLPTPSPLSPKTNIAQPFQQQTTDEDLPSLQNLNLTNETNNFDNNNKNNDLIKTTPQPFTKFLSKAGNYSPKPFSSVSAPVPTPNYNTLPKAAPLSPVASAPAPSFSPASSTAEKNRSVNIVWPPPPEESDIPTASPLYFPPPSQVKIKPKKLEVDDNYCEELEEIDNMAMYRTPKMSLYSEEFYETSEDRRSAVECAEAISETLKTQKLVENVLKGQPRSSSPPPIDQDIKVSKIKFHETKQEIKEESFKESSVIEQKQETTELRRPVDYTPNTIECQLKAQIENAVPKQWESQMVQALKTVPGSPPNDPFARIPSKHSSTPLASALSVAPSEPFNPLPPLGKSTVEPVPLPEETEPYFPPEHPILIESAEPKAQKRDSQFVSALRTAPERPFTPTGANPGPKKKKDPLADYFKDLPKPERKLTMRDALTTASDRPYTPIIEIIETETKKGNVESKEMGESITLGPKPVRAKAIRDTMPIAEQKPPEPPSYPWRFQERIETKTDVTEEQKVVDVQKSTTVTEQKEQTVQSNVKVEEQPIQGLYPLFKGFSCSFDTTTEHSHFNVEVSTSPPVPNLERFTPVAQPAKETVKTETKVVERSETVSKESKEKKVVEKQAENVILKKPLPLTAGLHKPETLPQYQKNISDNAEAELLMMKKKEEAALRHKEEAALRIQKARLEMQAQTKIQPKPTITVESSENTREPPRENVLKKPIITVQPGDNTLRVEQSFKPVREDRPPKTSFSPRPGSITPSLINKAPPVIPYYQANLVAQQYMAPPANIFDPTSPATSRSPSPHPDYRPASPFKTSRTERPKSPAAGPPPNPLRSHQPPPRPQDVRIEAAKKNVETFIPQHQSRMLYESGAFENVQQYEQTNVCPREVKEEECCKKKVSCLGKACCPEVGGTCSVVSNKQIANAASFQKMSQRTQEADISMSVAQYAHLEHQEQSSQKHSQSIERSKDGSVQIQRKRTVTEEFEHSRKAQMMEIEKNVTKTKTYPSTSVKMEAIEERVQQSVGGGVHVTNPQPLAPSFLQPKVESKPQRSAPLTEPRPLIVEEQTKPAASFKHVPAPSEIAPIRHVQAPSNNKQKPSGNQSNIPVPNTGTGGGRQAGAVGVAPKRGRGVLNAAALAGARVPLCAHCHNHIRGPFITALGKIWCPEHFICATPSCRRPLQDLGFVEERGQLYCEYCFEQYLAPACSKCGAKIKGDCLKAIGKNFHPECFNCVYCGKLFGNSPFFLEDGNPYCEADWNELFTTKCFACGFPVEAGDRWVEALNNNYHSQCFNCTMCKKNLEGQSFFAKGGRPYCKNHAR